MSTPAAQGSPQLETILTEVDGDTLVATLHRPGRLNAVSSQLLVDLVSLAAWLRDHDEVHFLVLDHHGDVFSAGADLQDVKSLVGADNAPAVLRANQRLAQDMMAKMSGIDQISFAALRGSAYGAGVAIAMTCDFRVMADDAVLNLPETRLGMFLTYGSTPRLVHAVGLAAAKQMILFAEDWSAEQCLTAGAVQEVTPQAEVRVTIDRMIGVLRERDWDAIRVAKQVANAAQPMQTGDMVMPEPELVARALSSGVVEGHLDAFLSRKS